MCGVFGIWGDERAAEKAYFGLFALQHRGQESAGIAVTSGRGILEHRGMGLVGEVFGERELAELPGRAAVGHVRYSTTGSSRLVNAQPLVVNCGQGPMAIAHNGNLVNSRELRDAFERRGSIFSTTTDSEVIVHLLAQPGPPALAERFLARAGELRGAYTLVLLSEREIIGIRDPQGFRPLSLGQTEEGAWVLASETCALDLIGAHFVRDVEPGELVAIDAQGLRSHELPGAGAAHPCIFEHIYFARPDSLLFGEGVNGVRERFGRRLAQEHPARADIVVAVPDSGNAAALGYARASGIPLQHGFVRNHYVGRTFIQPSIQERISKVRIKLNVIRQEVQGRRVVVVDDSIIRGTTSRSRIQELRHAGAREVHLRISCPPHRHPCHYGIDFTSKTELVATGREVGEIARLVGADSLGYLSREGMLACMREAGPASFCTACFDGAYPVPVPEALDRHVLERERGRPQAQELPR